MTKHRCENPFVPGDFCEEGDGACAGRFFMDNRAMDAKHPGSAYATEVNFCPFCGKEAPSGEHPLVASVTTDGRYVTLTTYVNADVKPGDLSHLTTFSLLFRRAEDAAEFARIVREAKRPR